MVATGTGTGTDATGTAAATETGIVIETRSGTATDGGSAVETGTGTGTGRGAATGAQIEAAIMGSVDAVAADDLRIGYLLPSEHSNQDIALPMGTAQFHRRCSLSNIC